MKLEIKCAQCSKIKNVYPCNLKRNPNQFCNKYCYAEYQQSHPANTGRTWFKKGSIPKNYKDGLSQNGYVRGNEHQKVWLSKSKFYTIPKGCVVHHINGNRIDNRQENLTLLPRSYHMMLHRAIQTSNGKLKLPEV